MVEDYDYTSSNDFLGQNTLPFNSLRTGMFKDGLWGGGVALNLLRLIVDFLGYRHVRLLKLDGSSLSPASLFVHIKLGQCESSDSRAKSPAKKP